MLAFIRVAMIFLISIFICVFGILYCLCDPFNPQNSFVFSRYFGRMFFILGIKIEVRYFVGVAFPKNCIFIANHQSIYDMLTVSNVVQSNTITVGKKSLLWIPLFGLLYWLSGNLLISRNNFKKFHDIIMRIVNSIKKYNISIWIFPEGTRNQGKGLLPFKVGAFYAAIAAGVPIIPVCVSDFTNKIRLNRWSNGSIIIEVLSPLETKNYSISQARWMSRYCYDLMKIRINTLNLEVDNRDSSI